MHKIIFHSRISIMAFLFAILYGGCVHARTACVFTVPEGWSEGTVRWDGECRAGHADGLGVLKEWSGKSAKRFFFGQIKDGELYIGVIDQSDGNYLAGRFDHGRLVPTEDRQAFIDAFNKAATAAREAAARFEKNGNKGSARFYLDKAKALSEQMD